MSRERTSTRRRRSDYALSCRAFQTQSRPSGLPDPRWLGDPLLRARRSDWQRRPHILAPAERRFCRVLLERFAVGDCPSADEVSLLADELGLERTSALAALAEADLMHFSPDGAPLVAYPFSAVARGYRVLIDGSVTVEAMCAVDALGIAPMLGLSTETRSQDPLTTTVVEVRVEPSGRARWSPRGAVVLSAQRCCGGPSFESCCDTLNFFESEASARRYLVAHPDVTGDPISIPEAVKAGKTAFGELLRNLGRTAWPAGEAAG